MYIWLKHPENVCLHLMELKTIWDEWGTVRIFFKIAGQNSMWFESKKKRQKSQFCCEMLSHKS